MSAHLAGCDLCAARVAELERLCLLMRGRRVAPAEGLRERIMELCGTAIPVRRLSCREAQELASAYIDDELNELERETLEAHLFACESCFAAYVRTRTACEALRAVPAAPTRDDLKERILAAVAADAADAEAVIGYIAPPLPQYAPWRRVAASVAAIAAIALLGFGVFQMNSRQQSETVQVAATGPAVEAPALEPAAHPPGIALVERMPSEPAPVAEAREAPPAPVTAEAVRLAPGAAAPLSAARDAAPDSPVPATVEERPTRPAPSPAPAERVSPARPAVSEPPTIARRVEPGAAADEGRSVGLASVDRTPARGTRPAAPRVDAPLPAPPPPGALPPAAPDRGIATAAPLTRPAPLIAAPEPAPEAPRVATVAPATDETPETLRAAREGSPGASGSATRLYTGPRDISADLAERAAIINAQAAAERDKAASGALPARD